MCYHTYTVQFYSTHKEFSNLFCLFKNVFSCHFSMAAKVSPKCVANIGSSDANKHIRVLHLFLTKLKLYLLCSIEMFFFRLAQSIPWALFLNSHVPLVYLFHSFNSHGSGNKQSFRSQIITNSLQNLQNSATLGGCECFVFGQPLFVTFFFGAGSWGCFCVHLFPLFMTKKMK